MTIPKHIDKLRDEKTEEYVAVQEKLRIAEEALEKIIAPIVDDIGNWLSDEDANAEQVKIARKALKQIREGK